MDMLPWCTLFSPLPMSEFPMELPALLTRSQQPVSVMNFGHNLSYVIQLTREMN